MRRFWYFDVSVWSGEQKLWYFGLCQNGVLAPYCKDWEWVRPIFLFFGFAREKSFVTVAKSPCTDVHGHDHGLGNWDDTCEQDEPPGGKREVEALGPQPDHSQCTGWTGKLPGRQIWHHYHHDGFTHHTIIYRKALIHTKMKVWWISANGDVEGG